MFLTKKYKLSISEREQIITLLKKQRELEVTEAEKVTSILIKSNDFPSIAVPLFELLRKEIITNRQQKYTNLIERLRR